MRASTVLPVLAVALMSVGCSHAATDSGVKGTVTIGPTSPVQMVGQSGTAPYAAAIIIRNDAGATVTEVRSSAAGLFVVALPPGRYVLVPQSPGMFPRAEPVAVTVVSHEFTEVSLQYDTGIR